MTLYLVTTKSSRARDIENTRVVSTIDQAIEHLATLEVTLNGGIGNDWRVWEVFPDRVPKLLNWWNFYGPFIRRVFEKKGLV